VHHGLIVLLNEYHSKWLIPTRTEKGAAVGFATIFGPDLLVLVVLLCAVAVPVWAIVDAANRPAVAFYGAGSNKTAWIVVIAIAWLIGLGFFLGGFYLLFSRPKVRRQMEQLRS
jgi:hypothetical protein